LKATGHDLLAVRQAVFGARVKAENAGDDLIEFARDTDFPPPAAIGSIRVMIHLEVRRKRVQQIA
jgi:hypothetical protein